MHTICAHGKPVDSICKHEHFNSFNNGQYDTCQVQLV